VQQGPDAAKGPVSRQPAFRSSPARKDHASRPTRLCDKIDASADNPSRKPLALQIAP
jgi:hypothetical protein